MKVSLNETSENVEFTVLEREGISDETLAGMFYTLEAGVFRKGIPRSALMFPHDLALMEKNYNAYLPAELHPGTRTLADLEAALEWICTEFAQREVRWWLAGSGALYVRGLAIQPHDLDLMTFKTEIEKIRGLVVPFIVEPFHHVTGWVVKGFGVVDYRYRIDVAFEPEDWVDGQGPVDFGPYAQAHVEKITWRGHEILVPPLELHLAANEARGRYERVALIRESLQAASNSKIS